MATVSKVRDGYLVSLSDLQKLQLKCCNVEVLWVFPAIRFWQQFDRITCLGVVSLQVCTKYTKAVKQHKKSRGWFGLQRQIVIIGKREK